MLEVTDPDTLTALSGYEGLERVDFALLALKIGTSALQVAGGHWQVDVIRGESSRLVEQLTFILGQHQDKLNYQLEQQLQLYFAPQSGRFNERIDRLLRKDGELESVLRAHVTGEHSQLVVSLQSLIGPNSPLLRLLSPSEQTGVVQALRSTVDAALFEQRQEILRQFSLDDERSAISRLMFTLTNEHQKLSTGMETRLIDLTDNFSLDKKDSAINRLLDRFVCLLFSWALNAV